MTWNLQSIEHETFKRNTVAAVIAQIRFHPILKVPDRVAEFQDRVRGTFPGFAEVETREVGFRSPLGLEVREGKEFQFRKQDGSAMVNLGPAAIALENRDHKSHKDFLADMKVATDALLEVFSPIAPTRLGLRYVNSINREAIAADLKRPVEWSHLLDSKFISVPTELADLEDTLFSSEVRSPAERGMLTLRLGLLRHGDEEKAQYRLDLDRYVEGGFEMVEIFDLFELFTKDIYSLFRAAAGATLLEWMELKT
ncbi:MAG: hypothetical protein A2289_21195 [Deltaproteobacteria bacterium RIFOXYA12_FULL_58_15]|nr:MAG: hypothetical protein A2289_21195 [Deltaproteobacteria bacterium RIFOXYA12_FULL_58_15]OGR08721.1 MAG: hypothetical protein A2341_00805 [Deltaproteobacteria bacterium RIFOXYB12_FULL_58_9]